MSFLQRLHVLDQQLFQALSQLLAEPWVAAVMRFFSSDWPWLLALVGLVLLMMVRRSGLCAYAFLACILCGHASDAVVRVWLQPWRLSMAACIRAFSVLPSHCSSVLGAPSAHAAGAMSVAVVVGLLCRRSWVALAFALASLIGLSRVVLGVHYPSDVLAGFALGTFIAVSVYGLIAAPASLKLWS